MGSKKKVWTGNIIFASRLAKIPKTFRYFLNILCSLKIYLCDLSKHTSLKLPKTNFWLFNLLISSTAIAIPFHCLLTRAVLTGPRSKQHRRTMGRLLEHSNSSIEYWRGYQNEECSRQSARFSWQQWTSGSKRHVLF